MTPPGRLVWSNRRTYFIARESNQAYLNSGLMSFDQPTSTNESYKDAIYQTIRGIASLIEVSMETTQNMTSTPDPRHSPVMYQITSVVVDGMIDEALLLQANRMARSVFEPEISESSHAFIPPVHKVMQLSMWREKLKIPHANILCITEPSSQAQQAVDGGDNQTERPTPQPESAQINSDGLATQRMLAISFNTPRHQDDIESYHVFIAAVHPSARGLGLLSRLLIATKEDAWSAGHKALTIATYPNRFPTMYALLSREGSDWEVVKWEDENSEKMGRVLMKMRLD